MELNLVYGLNPEKRIVHIDNVQRGLNCNCICPECKTKLVAKKGEINKHHFAHSNGQNCIKALETAIHLLAKQIISQADEIFLSKDQVFTYDLCELEKSYEDIIPDVILTKDDEIIFVEIVVTNNIDRDKEIKIKRINIKTLVIDLSKIDRQIDEEDLKIEVLANCEIRELINGEEGKVLNDQNSVEPGIIWWGVGVVAVVIWMFCGKSKKSRYISRKRYNRRKRKRRN